MKNRVRYVVAQLLRLGDGAKEYSAVHDCTAALSPCDLQAQIRASEIVGYLRT